MADLDILKALRDPKLHVQGLPKPPTKKPAKQNVPLVNGQRIFESEEWVDGSKSPEYSQNEDEDEDPKEPSSNTTIIPHQGCTCANHADSSYRGAPLKLIAIENWIELLEAPSESCIFLGKGNWQARQAAMAISIARQRKTCVLSERTCWACIVEQYQGISTGSQVVTFIS